MGELYPRLEMLNIALIGSIKEAESFSGVVSPGYFLQPVDHLSLAWDGPCEQGNADEL